MGHGTSVPSWAVTDTLNWGVTVPWLPTMISYTVLGRSLMVRRKPAPWLPQPLVAALQGTRGRGASCWVSSGHRGGHPMEQGQETRRGRNAGGRKWLAPSLQQAALWHQIAHPLQVHGPASGLLVVTVARMETVGLPCVVRPQLCTVRVPLALAPERHLQREEGVDNRHGSEAECQSDMEVIALLVADWQRPIDPS